MNRTQVERPPMDRYQRWLLIVGIAGLALSVIGLFFNSAQFFRSYLFSYVFWVQLSLGCLAIVMIHHLAGGHWSFVIRRILEAGLTILPGLAILFVPLLFGMSSLYEWARPDAVAHDELLQHKQPYLNVPFFILRTVVYFIIWAGAAYLLRRWSVRQDETASRAIAYRTKLFSGPALGAVALTVTFASFDWMMSLEPHWFSSIYGMMFAVGMLAAAFSFAILMLAWLVNYPPLSEKISAKHFNDLGNFLLASVMLWAYIALSQYLIIWSGNLPEETPWYIRRSQGGWQIVTVTLVALHFALPFLVLLSRTVKRRMRLLSAVAALVIAMRALDLFWLIAPAFHPEGFYLHWLDITAFVGIGGIWAALFLWFLKKQPLLPLYDIRVEEEVVEQHGRKEAQSYQG